MAQNYNSIILFQKNHWNFLKIKWKLTTFLVVLTGKGNSHGFSHAYIGATLIAIFSALTGKWVYQVIMVFIKKDFTDYQKLLFDVNKKLTMRVCVVSAFIGTYSHVLLNSIMHANVEPYYPIYLANDINLIISIESLYKLCLYTGLLGVVVFFIIRDAKLKK